MTNRTTDSSQGEGGHPPPAPGPPDHLHSRAGNKVFKSGSLFLSSKGIGWTSWKKRWFILTRTSLVFFRSDPNAVPQKGGEVNLTLGGIDLNNSGSVVVKADKKLLTVLFPDGLKEKQPVKSLVLGRPILLALEDIDGTPSFLEKAFRFVEDHGVKVEGILRQAADVDDVEHRIREYEQGKIDFSPEEDAHVIADCAKYVLRELPSSPVPASCCKALLEACRTDRGRRVAAMREAICETFPEPNRRLLQRILMMMQTVASHKAENRMSTSAVAACMAPLLLRPLLAGDCELEHDFDVGGDGSIQLLQAAAAANHAQAIVVTLLEEYENIFGEGSMSTELYSDSEESGSESEELTDDDETFEDDGDEDLTEGSGEDYEYASNESETCDIEDDNVHDDKGSDGGSVASKSNESADDYKANQKSSASSPQSSSDRNVQSNENGPNQSNNGSSMQTNESREVLADDPAETSLAHKFTDKTPSSRIQSSTTSNGPVHGARRAAVWGRTPAKKNLSMESIDLPIEDEAEIERLEATKIDLQNRIAEEAQGNAALRASLQRRKNALLERRLALEQDVASLQEQLKKERELRAILEAGLELPQGSLPVLTAIDGKTKAELEEIALAEADVINLKQKADDLGMQLNQQREQSYGLAHGLGTQAKLKEKEREIETTVTLQIPERSTRSKDAQLDKVDGDKEMKQDLSFFANKNLPQNQQFDPGRNSKSVGIAAAFSIPESVLGRSAPANSKKFGARGEGGATSTASALSKLTNRLNFLKERRSQIASELQNMDKGQGGPSAQTFERGRGSEYRQLVHGTTDGTIGFGSSHSHHNIDTGISLQNSDKGRLEELSAPNLERGKSESFPNMDKGRRSENHPLVPPRTYSR
ncbi:Rho GTPase-activating protein [Actinidia chinensis var. chinensis]|uniref:Rho GTPase-activating protein n=1 Tax=Actinidia chinensis var. chinensis TaxID=1590841 RepID=A0A2R6QYD4_ACTCC|nr:Rho GTPase-activating protein [Actinidia chinensis var. chinensis]